jgi:hypothetical protein
VLVSSSGRSVHMWLLDSRTMPERTAPARGLRRGFGARPTTGSRIRFGAQARAVESLAARGVGGPARALAVVL